MNDKFRPTNLFKGSINSLLGLLGFIAGPFLVFKSILSIAEGIALFVFSLLFILGSTLYKCIKGNAVLQKEMEKIQQNRDGLLEVKENYFNENRQLKDEITNINQTNLRLNFKLEANRIMIVQFMSINANIIPAEFENILIDNYDLEGGADINGKQIL